MDKRTLLCRAFVRGGSMSDPAKSYHLEFVCEDALSADLIQKTMEDFGIRSGRTARKGHTVVYLKDGEDIANLLNVMGAHKQLLELENLRIVKEMRGRVNRRVNCDAANIKKTVGAAAVQIEAIRYLETHGGLRRHLTESLVQAARLRLSYPEATLAELSERMKPALKKSGMNHRLQKIVQIYREVKKDVEKEDQDRKGA